MAKNFCQNCGAKIEKPGDVFCTNCGAPLIDGTPPALATPEQPAAPLATPQFTAPAVGQPGQGASAAAVPPSAAAPTTPPAGGAPTAPGASAPTTPGAAPSFSGGAHPAAASPTPAAGGAQTTGNVQQAQQQLLAVEQDLQSLFDSAQPAPAVQHPLPAQQPPVQSPPPGVHAAPAQRPAPAPAHQGKPAEAPKPPATPAERHTAPAYAAPQSPAFTGNPAASQPPLFENTGNQAAPSAPPQRPQATTGTVPPAHHAPGGQPSFAPPRQPAAGTGQDLAALFASEQAGNSPAPAERDRKKPSVTAIFNASQNAVNTAPVPKQTTPPPARAPRGPMPSPRFEEYAKPSKGGSIVKVVLIVLMVLVLLAGIALGVLFFLNRPGAAIDTFSTALEQKNVATLQQKVALGTGLAASEQDWLALASAFEETGPRNRLRSQLNNQEGDTPSVGAEYPAITIQSEPLFLFINRHYILLQPVEVLVPAAGTDTILVLNDAIYNGEASGDGMLYGGIMPGRYEAQLYIGNTPAPDTTAQQLEIFAVEAPTVFTGKGEGTSTPLPDPNDIEGNPASSQTNKDVAEALTEQEINKVMGEFYLSYLNCLNDQNTDMLRSATNSAKATVQERIGVAGNQQNIFEYVGVACDAQSIVRGESNGLPAVSFNAAFQYKYVPRDGSAEKADGANYQTVQMVYEDGTWKVDQFVFVSDADYAAHTLAELAA